MDNLVWSKKILSKYDPSFKHRWEIYNETVRHYLDDQKIWIDCGCGINGMVRTYGKYAKKAIGVDLIDIKGNEEFVKADIKALPFPSSYADLITLRFVVEHFQDENNYLPELIRTLKKGGKIIIITTNLLSPIIFIPRLLLPYPLKNKILTKLFKVTDDDVFPTYHKLNTLQKYRKMRKSFIIRELLYISDLNYKRKWIFILLFIWHMITKSKSLRKFRTNLLIVLEKK